MTDTTILQKTPLHDAHVDFGGRMVDFSGWSLPISFAGITEEHRHTRNACSVFDVSHMGRLVLTGEDCESFLNRICTRNLMEAEVGRSYYSHICREDGGILDDVIVSRFEDRWGVVCNGANRQKIVGWLDQHREGTDVLLRDETTSTAMVAVQGPKTMELAAEITGQDLASMKRYRHVSYEFMGMKVTVYRCGYTGEDGVEVVIPAGIVKLLLPRLLGNPKKPHPIIKPAGLGARDTLRIEAAMPLYGHELSEDVDPLSAGQAWCVDLNKEFLGADAMRKKKAEGLLKQMTGLELDGRRIARQHQRVFVGANDVGEITSGTLSPTIGKSIAMAFVDVSCREEGTFVEVEISGKRVGARVVKMPFYTKPK